MNSFFKVHQAEGKQAKKFDKMKASEPVKETGIGPEGGMLSEKLSDKINQERGKGSPLSAVMREKAEKKFGVSFYDVKVHQDESADHLSHELNARAFTIGKDIFVKKGSGLESGSRGEKTMLHELTHVVQQGFSSQNSGSIRVGAENTSQEKEAEHNAE